MNQAHKRIIGVTGGVGAGKSTVLGILEETFGARVILADLVAHRLMEPGTEGLSRITQAFGTDFLKEDGSVDRSLLAARLFADDAMRVAMNQILHPLVWETIEQEAREAKEKLVIVEAAVFDTAPSGFFDEIWYIYADETERIRRLMESRGYTRKRCREIMAGQASEESYRTLCSRIIDNSGDRENIKEQLKEILRNEVC